MKPKKVFFVSYLSSFHEKGSEPYVGLSNKESIEYVQSGKSLDRPSSLPEELWTTIEKCFIRDAQERISFYGFNQEFVDYLQRNSIILKDWNRTSVNLSNNKVESEFTDNEQDWSNWKNRYASLVSNNQDNNVSDYTTSTNFNAVNENNLDSQYSKTPQVDRYGYE